jgi:hypothetical protein
LANCAQPHVTEVVRSIHGLGGNYMLKREDTYDDVMGDRLSDVMRSRIPRVIQTSDSGIGISLSSE